MNEWGQNSRTFFLDLTTFSLLLAVHFCFQLTHHRIKGIPASVLSLVSGDRSDLVTLTFRSVNLSGFPDVTRRNQVPSALLKTEFPNWPLYTAFVKMSSNNIGAVHKLIDAPGEREGSVFCYAAHWNIYVKRVTATGRAQNDENKHNITYTRYHPHSLPSTYPIATSNPP